jgi:hypothetical protein
MRLSNLRKRYVGGLGLLNASKSVLALYTLGIRGFSIEGDIEFEIQESRRTVLAALSAHTSELQHTLIEQSRAADLRDTARCREFGNRQLSPETDHLRKTFWLRF